MLVRRPPHGPHGPPRRFARMTPRPLPTVKATLTECGSASRATCIEDFKIGDFIARGSFSVVSKASHVSSGELVAMKVLWKERISASAIQRELDILASMTHVNVIRFHAAFETAQLHYVVIELGDQTLDAVCANGLNEDDARGIFDQLSVGMEYVHKQRIVHRDLKPENICLRSHTVKIIDFGFARTFRTNELLHTAVGTPCWLPPEMVKRQPYAPCKIDAWSSGAILYFIVSGRLPFQAETLPRLYQKICGAHYEPLEVGSGALWDLAAWILTPDPAERPAFANIRAHRWLHGWGPGKRSLAQATTTQRSSRSGKLEPPRRYGYGLATPARTGKPAGAKALGRETQTS